MEEHKMNAGRSLRELSIGNKGEWIGLSLRPCCKKEDGRI
jgi:hypothetical protein